LFALGDTVTVVTRKSDKLQGDWILTGDIIVRFPSRRAAGAAYEQQRNQQNNRETQAARLIGHSGQVCPTLIPIGHSGETSQDDSLHKALIACQAFRGKDINGIQQLLRDSLQEIYDRLYDIDVETMEPPKDYYTAIATATDAAGEGHTAELDPHTLFYLLEILRLTKVGGPNSPYACAEWPLIQNPQAILALLDNKGLHITFFNDKRESEDHILHFYERKPAGRGLDFDEYPETKSDFVRYTVELRCLNPVVDTKKTPLPPLEDLAEAVSVLLHVGLQPHKKPKKELDKLLHAEGTTKEWFPDNRSPCSRDLRINGHLGAGGVMTPGRIQDPEGAKIVVISFKTAAGAVATIHKQTYKIVCSRGTTGGRLRVRTTATSGRKQDPSKQGRRSILIYKS
jgi:uncharacterized protein (DUF1330 family)